VDNDNINIVWEEENHRSRQGEVALRMPEGLRNGMIWLPLQIIEFPLIKQRPNNAICFRAAVTNRNKRKGPHCAAERVEDPTIIVREESWEDLTHDLASLVNLIPKKLE